MNTPDPLPQLGIGLDAVTPWARVPRIVPTGRHLQYPAHGGDRMGGPVHRHQFEDLDGIEPVSRANQAAAFSRPEAAELLALGGRQAVSAPALVAIRLAHPVPNRLGRRLEFLAQRFRRSPGANQLDHPTPELWWIGSSCTWHRGTSLPHIGARCPRNRGQLQFPNPEMYIELHTSSAFSFLEGATLSERMVECAAELGYSALALLDRDGVYGAPRFHQAATAAGIKPIIGCEITIRASGVTPRGWGSNPESHIPHPEFQRPEARDQGPGGDSPCLWRLPVLVESQEGYRNLCRVLTRMKLDAAKGEGALVLEDLEGCTGGLVALAGRAALMGGRYGVGGLLDRLVSLFGRSNVYVELQRHLLAG